MQRLAVLGELAAAQHRRTLLTRWLSKWRLALRRSREIAAREGHRQQLRLALAWQAWRLAVQDGVLQRGLAAAACLHRRGTLLRQALAGWRGATAERRQVELPPCHPVVLAAAQQQRRRLLGGCFASWRRYLRHHAAPREVQVQLRVLELSLDAQRRAFEAWQQYLQQRRLEHALAVSGVWGALRWGPGHCSLLLLCGRLPALPLAAMVDESCVAPSRLDPRA